MTNECRHVMKTTRYESPEPNHLTQHFLCDPRYHALFETAAMFGSYCLCRYDTKTSGLDIVVTKEAIKIKAWSERYGCPRTLWTPQPITKMLKSGNQKLAELIYKSGSKTLTGNLYIVFESEIADALALHLLQLNSGLTFDDEVGDYLIEMGIALGEMVLKGENTVTCTFDLTPLIKKPEKIRHQPASPKAQLLVM
jgi:hypothetical protein